MKKDQDKYRKFALCREMLHTVEILRDFDAAELEEISALVRSKKKCLLTGEGSSRIFPAKRARYEALKMQDEIIPVSEGATQAGEYNLKDYAVLGSSNSGRTRELVRLFRNLRNSGIDSLAAVTANRNTDLEEAAEMTHILSCGKEEAVAASMSVIEQALVWQAVMSAVNHRQFPDLNAAAQLIERALTTDLPDSFVQAMCKAKTIFFAGRNDGVAEELSLKSIEIVRKASVFLEGTYAVHGIEEIIQKDDVVIIINPFPEEEKKFNECLKGAGANIFAIADRETLFPTFKMPQTAQWKEYVFLCGGWNLLIEAGLASSVNLDKPLRARKIGNVVDNNNI